MELNPLGNLKGLRLEGFGLGLQKIKYALWQINVFIIFYIYCLTIGLTIGTKIIAPNTRTAQKRPRIK